LSNSSSFSPSPLTFQCAAACGQMAEWATLRSMLSELRGSDKRYLSDKIMKVYFAIWMSWNFFMYMFI